MRGFFFSALSLALTRLKARNNFVAEISSEVMRKNGEKGSSQNAEIN